MATQFTFPKDKQEEFLQRIREGMRRGAATDAVFGSNDAERRRKVRDYIESHPQFEKRVLDAEVEATEHVEEALYQAAVSGSVPAAKAWLELRGVQFPEKRGRPPKPDEPLPAPGGDNDPFAIPDVPSLDAARAKRRT